LKGGLISFRKKTRRDAKIWRQHDEEVRVQKELVAREQKVDTLENVVITNRNKRAANEEEAYNQTRKLEERVRNITEELDRVN